MLSLRGQTHVLAQVAFAPDGSTTVLEEGVRRYVQEHLAADLYA